MWYLLGASNVLSPASKGYLWAGGPMFCHNVPGVAAGAAAAAAALTFVFTTSTMHVVAKIVAVAAAAPAAAAAAVAVAAPAAPGTFWQNPALARYPSP